MASGSKPSARRSVLLALCLAGSGALAAPCDDYAAQLVPMVAADQAIRALVGAQPEFSARIGRAWEVIDAQNLKRFRVLLQRCGWPVASRYGWDASDAAWLLVQHADSDRPFQHQAIRILARAVRAGEARGAQLAYLSDRLAVAEGRPQPYGTQFKVDNCRLVLAPIDSREAVNQRRRAIAGMPSLEAYEAQAVQEFSRSPCAAQP